MKVLFIGKLIVNPFRNARDKLFALTQKNKNENNDVMQMLVK